MRTYKAYRYEVRQTNRLSAKIWAPGSPRALRDTPQATLKEGDVVLVKRVQAVIEKDIEKMAAREAEKEARPVSDSDKE